MGRHEGKPVFVILTPPAAVSARRSAGRGSGRARRAKQKVQLQEGVKRLLRPAGEPTLGQLLGLGVELPMRMAVGIAPPGEPPQVAVELRTDVQELVGDGRELLAKGKIEEPRQIEVQHVEHLAAVDLDPLDRELPPAANRSASGRRRTARGSRRRTARGTSACGSAGN